MSELDITQIYRFFYSIFSPMFLISYSQDGRSLRKMITTLLKSQAATEIQRLNYVKSYKLVDKQITKTEQKLVLIDFDSSQEKKLRTLLAKFYDGTIIEVAKQS